jgi:hypothetical protein
LLVANLLNILFIVLNRHRREHPGVKTLDLDAIRSGRRYRQAVVQHRHAILSSRRG